MAVMDALTPKFYQILRMGIQKRDGEVLAIYDIAIHNAAGQIIGTVNPNSTLTSQERAAIAVIYQRDKAQFETATGLTEWVPPEGP